MLKLFIIKPHGFNKISKSANWNYNGKYIYKYSQAIFFQGSKGTEGGGSGSEMFSITKGGGGAPKKIEPLAKGAAKISSFEFQYLHPPCYMK